MYFQSVIVAAAAGLAAVGCASGDSAAPNIEALEDYARAYQENAAFDGVVLIAEGDDIVYLKAFGKADYELNTPMEVDTRFRVASLSKDITSAAIGRLIDNGQVAFDAPLSDYLPAFPNAQRITIRHLLDHRSGVPHTNTLAWMDMTKSMTLDEIVKGLAGEPLDFEPGEDRRYSNGGYALLAAVIEAASGKKYDAFLREEFSEQGYSSIGHEAAYEVVPKMAERYAPGPRYGERSRATPYLVSNRIGGGSLYANAEDLFRIFRNAYYGDLVSDETREALFPKPTKRAQVTGRSPGALAQIAFEPESEITVVSLSSNSAWPGGFNRDLMRFYIGEAVSLAPFSLATGEERRDFQIAVVGNYFNERFDWEISIELQSEGLIFVQDELRTAFVPTIDGEYFLPVYDWLCALDQEQSLTCRQRDPDAEIRFVFTREGT